MSIRPLGLVFTLGLTADLHYHINQTHQSLPTPTQALADNRHRYRQHSGSVPMATNSRHNHPGQTHSRLSKCNVADHLCLPNQPIIAEWSLHAETVNCIFGTGDSRGHVCHSPQHASSPVYVSNPGPLSTCYR